jgi:Fimbrial assembly protein (PilN)
MIRINLIPQKVSRTETLGKQYLLFGFLFVMVTGGACYYHYNFMLDLTSIKKNKKKISSYNRTYNNLKNELKKYKSIPVKERKQLFKEYKQRLETVSRIEKVRSNPVFALLELSRILSVGHMPTVSKTSTVKMDIDPNWDPSVIHFTSLVEKDRIVTVSGYAQNNYDISELAKRLKISAYYLTPEIEETKVTVDENKNTKVFFKIKAQMVY